MDKSIGIKKIFRYSFFITIPLYFLFERINYLKILNPTPLIFKIIFFCIVAAAIFYKLFQNRISKENRIIITAVSLYFYLFFKIIIDKLSAISFLSFLSISIYYYTFVIILYFTILLLLLKYFNQNKWKIIGYINALFLIFFAIELGKFIYQSRFTEIYKVKTEQITFKPIGKSNKPNIYFFILDEYAGSSSLREYFNFDNRPFLTELQKRNFFVPQNSNSNYNLTWASIPSIFEMGYFLNYKKEEFNKKSIYISLSEIMADNNLVKFFTNENYKIYNNSYFKINNTISDPELVVDISKKLLLSNTFGTTIRKGPMNHIPNNNLQQCLKTYCGEILNYNQRVIENTKSIIQKKENQIFLFSHLWMPHPPYLFSENGQVRKISRAYKELRNQENPNGYLNNLRYSNKLVLGFIDSIIEKKENCVIIICSDHGFRWYINKHIIENDFNNFIAVYNNSNYYKDFTDTTSNVNLFRILLNNHFEQKLPLLQNQKINVRDGHL